MASNDITHLASNLDPQEKQYKIAEQLAVQAEQIAVQHKRYHY